jgi:hypothetical protein
MSIVGAQLEPSSTLARGLRGYVTAVGGALGVGWESCSLGLDRPLSGYIALDWRLPDHPGRDLALLWDERHGWSPAVETHSGEDLIVLCYLGGPVVPEPRAVVRFVAGLRAGYPVGQSDPPGTDDGPNPLAGLNAYLDPAPG